MSLMSPTLGDKLDRISILTLKIPAFRALGKSAGHLEGELKGLLGSLDAPSLDLIIRLAQVNKALWDATEEQLSWHPDRDAGAGVLLVRISDLNRERRSLMEAIDRGAGEFSGPEKVK